MVMEKIFLFRLPSNKSRRKGIIGIINSSRNGNIACSLVVGEEDEIILSDKGSNEMCC